MRPRGHSSTRGTRARQGGGGAVRPRCVAAGEQLLGGCGPTPHGAQVHTLAKLPGNSIPRASPGVVPRSACDCPAPTADPGTLRPARGGVHAPLSCQLHGSHKCGICGVAGRKQPGACGRCAASRSAAGPGVHTLVHTRSHAPVQVLRQVALQGPGQSSACRTWARSNDTNWDSNAFGCIDYGFAYKAKLTSAFPHLQVHLHHGQHEQANCSATACSTTAPHTRTTITPHPPAGLPPSWSACLGLHGMAASTPAVACEGPHQVNDN